MGNGTEEEQEEEKEKLEKEKEFEKRSPDNNFGHGEMTPLPKS